MKRARVLRSSPTRSRNWPARPPQPRWTSRIRSARCRTPPPPRWKISRRSPRLLAEINNVINGIATAVEEQSAASSEIASNIYQASQGIAEVNENVAQSTVVIADITRDIAGINQQSIPGGRRQRPGAAERPGPGRTGGPAGATGEAVQGLRLPTLPGGCPASARIALPLPPILAVIHQLDQQAGTVFSSTLPMEEMNGAAHQVCLNANNLPPQPIRTTRLNIERRERTGILEDIRHGFFNFFSAPRDGAGTPA